MSLYYPQTTRFDIVGSRLTDSPFTLTKVALTNAYDVANKTKVFETKGQSKLNINVQYTTGTSETGTSLLIRVRNSDDGTNLFRIQNETVTGGTSQMSNREFKYTGGTGATTYNYSIGLDIFYPYMEVSVMESGVSTNYGTVYIGGTVLGR